MATDLKNLLRKEAAQCRRLAEIVIDETVRQGLIEMADRLQAAADEDEDAEQ